MPITIFDLNPSLTRFPLGVVDNGPPNIADRAWALGLVWHLDATFEIPSSQQ
jgi:hypothetical protein